MAKKSEPAVAPGELICPPIVVEGEAVPWKTPTVTRYGTTFKDKTLVAWQLHVASCAHKVLDGAAPYDDPVSIQIIFVRKHPKTRKPGEFADTRPDLDNLTKAVKDSLTGKAVAKLKVNKVAVGENFGRVLADDNVAVHYRDTIKVYGDKDLTVIYLYALPRFLPPDHPAWEFVLTQDGSLGNMNL